MSPGALTAEVGNETDADLRDCERQSGVDSASAVACLDAAIEKHPQLCIHELLASGLEDAGAFGRPRARGDDREQFLAYFCAQGIFLEQRLAHLFVNPVENGIQVAAIIPRIQIEGSVERFVKSLLEVLIADQWRWREIAGLITRQRL